MQSTRTLVHRLLVGCALVTFGMLLGGVAVMATGFFWTFSGLGDTTSTVIGTSPDGKFALLSVQSGFQDKVFWTELHTVPVEYERSSAPSDSSRCASGEMATGRVEVIRPEILVHAYGDSVTPVSVNWVPLRSDQE